MPAPACLLFQFFLPGCESPIPSPIWICMYTRELREIRIACTKFTEITAVS
ncbi:hypothetical protein OsI_14509 [Oryza sativa Indica Group]|uniref:Uncharacterized protein n=1 Tax=Oryza sativa subsp. indica TaxID=39946 RepID=B8ATY6_ORYSI|nr:hypothetical protein OsI_14509 [Oryza sativa Indica Group]